MWWFKKLQESLVDVSDISVCFSESEMVLSEKQNKKVREEVYASKYLEIFWWLWSIFQDFLFYSASWLTYWRKNPNWDIVFHVTEPSREIFLSKWIVHDQIKKGFVHEQIIRSTIDYRDWWENIKWHSKLCCKGCWLIFIMLL